MRSSSSASGEKPRALRPLATGTSSLSSTGAIPRTAPTNIAMEYVPGGDLGNLIENEGLLSPQRTVEIGLQVAEALRAAHERGTVHRDVKPRNILITRSGHVKVADFGIARAAEATTISHPGDILGSVKYMSPEQAAGEPVGPASDLYSLDRTSVV